MDHLLSPPGASEIIIPYLGGDIFEDFEPPGTAQLSTNTKALFRFKSFHSREPWERDWYGNLLNTTQTAKDFAIHIQTSLFFGLVISVFGCAGIKVTTKDFVREGPDGKMRICTEKLLDLIPVFIDKERAVKDVMAQTDGDKNNTKQLRQWHTDEMRGWTFRGLPTLVKEAKEKPDASNVPIDLIALSVMALGECLEAMLVQAYRMSSKMSTIWGPSEVLRDRLRQQGWCMSDSPFFPEEVQRTSICADYYFGGMQCPHLRRDSHAECSSVICSTYEKRVDEAIYAPQHAGSCQQADCHRVVAPMEVAQSVGSREIPIVLWDGNTIQTRIYTPGINYVAISHVWSDGLGNDNQQNFMYSCQLARIQNLVNCLYSDTRDENTGEGQTSENSLIGFWIDTLCVPVGQEHIKLRKSAIRQMADIYRFADRVLVLDKSMLRLSSGTSVIDKHLGIHLSNWHHRLWTLQEGQLGKSLYFQFSDVAQPFRDMQGKLDSATKEHSQTIQLFCPIEELSNHQLAQFYRYFEDRSKTLPIWIRMRACASYLRSRETSKAEDEPLCLSTVLGLDPAPLLSVSGLHDRMALFYDMIGEFDPRIIFNHHPKIQKDGYRWAPISFLKQAENLITMRHDIHPNHVSKIFPNGGGLPVRYLGMELHGIKPDSGTSIIVVPKTDNILPMYREMYASVSAKSRSSWHTSGSPWPWWLQKYAIELLPNTEGRYYAWQENVRYAIVSSSDIGDNKSHSSTMKRTTPVILVILEGICEDEFAGKTLDPVDGSINKSDPNTVGQYMARPMDRVHHGLVARFVSHAQAYLIPLALQGPIPDDWVDPSFSRLPEEGEIGGTFYSIDQKWCIR